MAVRLGELVKKLEIPSKSETTLSLLGCEGRLAAGLRSAGVRNNANNVHFDSLLGYQDLAEDHLVVVTTRSCPVARIGSFMQLSMCLIGATCFLTRSDR